jgi:OmpA-OmpF porin, OOP family
MKSIRLLIVAALLVSLTNPASAQLGRVLDRAGSSANSRANNKVDKTVNTGLNKAEGEVDKVGRKKTPKTPQSGQSSQPGSPVAVPEPMAEPDAADAPAGRSERLTSLPVASRKLAAMPKPATLRTYANYDFVPGSKPLFDDDFYTDQSGMLGANWSLLSGQAVLSKVGEVLVMNIIGGNVGAVTPKLKDKNYLPDEFTLECDYLQTAGASPLEIWFSDSKDRDVMSFRISRDGVSLRYPVNNETRTLPVEVTPDLQGDAFTNRWHHIAFVRNGKTLKLYIDQYRVAGVPDNSAQPTKVFFGGIGSSQYPVVFKNVRLAEGSGIADIGPALTKGKYIAYGLRFDRNRAALRPESMGELTAIRTALSDDLATRYEIGGHTDADTPDDVTLTMKRAEAVRQQLIGMGIDGTRLVAKGYGKAKSVGDKKTLAGKAQNRRIEFVKMKK